MSILLKASSARDCSKAFPASRSGVVTVSRVAIVGWDLMVVFLESGCADGV